MPPDLVTELRRGSFGLGRARILSSVWCGWAWVMVSPAAHWLAWGGCALLVCAEKQQVAQLIMVGGNLTVRGQHVAMAQYDTETHARSSVRDRSACVRKRDGQSSCAAFKSARYREDRNHLSGGLDAFKRAWDERVAFCFDSRFESASASKRTVRTPQALFSGYAPILCGLGRVDATATALRRLALFERETLVRSL